MECDFFMAQQRTPQSSAESGAVLSLPAGNARTCVVTRQTLSPESLLPLMLLDGTVAVGRGRTGRGVYVSIESKHILALDSRILSRAFRKTVPGFDAAQFAQTTHRLAEQRVRERLGLARRAGSLLVGIEQVRKAALNSTVVLASDLASRSSRCLEGSKFLTGQVLGASVGMGWIGAAAIVPGRLAKDASYWLRVWYETASVRSNRVKSVSGPEGSGTNRMNEEARDE